MTKRAFVISLVLLLLLLPHLSFTFWPEMFSRPFLLLAGWQPYTDIVMEHAPVLPYLLAGWFKLFGLGFPQLQLFTWVVIALTSGLVYLFSRNRLAVLVYLVLALAYSGNGIWYDLALTPVIFLVWLLVSGQRYFLAGLVFVFALFTKQTAVWFIPPLFFCIYRDNLAMKRFTIGFTIALVLGVVSLLFMGVFSGFIHWATTFRAVAIWPTPGQAIFAFAPFIVLLLPSAFAPRLLTGLKLFTLFGILGTFPRWELFHFQPALPYLSLLVAGFFPVRARLVTKCGYIIILALFLVRQFDQIWLRADRFTETDFLQTVQYVQTHTSPADKILVLNTWESLYALSGRLPSARPHLPYLPWYMDLPGIQENIVSSLRRDPPALVVAGQTQSSGLGSYIPVILKSYLEQNYHQTAKIGSLYVWQ